MKLLQLSWVLGMLAFIVRGVLTQSWSPLAEMSIGNQRVAGILLVILPAGIGTVLGAMSWNRKGTKTWWAAGIIVLNVVTLLAGILLFIL